LELHPCNGEELYPRITKGKAESHKYLSFA